jgi:hypothetical protein
MISQRPNPKAKNTGKIALLGGRGYATKGPKNYRLENVFSFVVSGLARFLIIDDYRLEKLGTVDSSRRLLNFEPRAVSCERRNAL